jgi:hypothetical protein
MTHLETKSWFMFYGSSSCNEKYMRRASGLISSRRSGAALITHHGLLLLLLLGVPLGVSGLSEKLEVSETRLFLVCGGDKS